MDPENFGSDIIGLALREDIGCGDVTTEHFISEEKYKFASLVARQDCILAGADVAKEVFQRLSPLFTFSKQRADGQRMRAGESAMEVHGPARALLSGERVALNFIQRLSGVATLTRTYTDAIANTNARILDTRKTTPGMRLMEKEAVVAGGGSNHRMGLFDMVMVKDNHLASCGALDSLESRIIALRKKNPQLNIEVEVDSIEQFKRLVTLPGIDRVLLDNMSFDDLRQAVALRTPNLELEASGGITLQNIRQVALTGVDFISVGALTHSAQAIDFGLDFR